MSPHKDQEYLADGVADEIIGALSRVPGLRVVGRTSSFSFKRKEVDLQAIGKALSAGLVLEGSVRTDGDRVRVGAQLVRVAEGSPIWSETYDRELRGILAMERDIAAAVAEALKLRLLPGQRALARRARTVDPEAYRKYLLAESIVQRPSGGKAAFEKAAGLLREAIVLDPTFAEAVADLGSLAYGLGAYSLEPGSVRRGCQAGLELIEKALTIDPELATGYRLRAYRRDACRLEREEAWRDLERAEAIEPGSAKVIRTRAALLLSRGRTREAASTYAQYLELDPLEAWSWLHYAQALAATDDLAGARKAVERALEVAPGFVEGHLFLGTLELIEGRPERARAQFDLVATPGDPDDGGDRISRALVEHDLGRAEEAERIVAPLRERPELAGDLASVYAWWGDRGRAFELIERAVADMDPEAMAFWWDPLWRKLRGDPRFTALLRRLKVDPEAATPAR
jgi:TolB-like protein/Flp pilus assembly protein TadD